MLTVTRWLGVLACIYIADVDFDRLYVLNMRDSSIRSLICHSCVQMTLRHISQKRQQEQLALLPSLFSLALALQLRSAGSSTSPHLLRPPLSLSC